MKNKIPRNLTRPRQIIASKPPSSKTAKPISYRDNELETAFHELWSVVFEWNLTTYEFFQLARRMESELEELENPKYQKGTD